MEQQQSPHGGDDKPVGLRDFYTPREIFAAAGLAHWSRIGEVRAALRRLCEEQDTERERYRQETIRRAQEGGAG